MRQLLFVALLMTLASAARAAPAPLPRRADVVGPDALLKQVQAELQAALQMRKDLNDNADELTPNEYITKARKVRDLLRQAAETLTRIAETTTQPRPRREVAALAAASAWQNLSDYRRALAMYELVLTLSKEPTTRAVAEEGATRCFRTLNRANDIRRRK